jgi:hypothetical protein
VRTLSSHPARFVKALFAVALVGLAACGGGGSSTLPNPGSNGICDPTATGIQLARPTPGFPQNGNTIEIVVNGNSDQLGNSQFTGMFDLNLFDQFNNEIDTNFLSAVADPSGPHPYSSDFFYQGTLQGNLASGRTYSVYLNAPNTNCQRGFVGSFST